AVPVVERHVSEPRAMRDPRVVDEAVDSPVQLTRLIDESKTALRVRHVQASVHDLARAGRVRGRVIDDVRRDHVRALAGQPCDLGRTLPARGTRDDDALSLDPPGCGHGPIGAAVSRTDSIVSPTKSASWVSSISHVPSCREISQIRLQRSKRRSMKRPRAPSRSSDDVTSSVSTIASSIAIAAPAPPARDVACAESPTRTTRPRYQGEGTRSE